MSGARLQLALEVAHQLLPALAHVGDALERRDVRAPREHVLAVTRLRQAVLLGVHLHHVRAVPAINGQINSGSRKFSKRLGEMRSADSLDGVRGT